MRVSAEGFSTGTRIVTRRNAEPPESVCYPDVYLPTMRVRVLFFGMLRDLVGRPSDESEFPQGASLRDVFEAYAERHPRVRELAPSIVVARNQEFAELSTI